jgi:hypothetical protein
MCTAKFMDPEFSSAHAAFVAEHSDVLTEGFATTARSPRGEGYDWVCADCFRHFATEFGWAAISPDD